MGKAKSGYMIIDGQWGSTGKGLLAGYLALTNNPDVVVCNFGPNAGHTFRYNKGGSERTIMTQMLPTGIVGDEVRCILLGPGAIIDPVILLKEMATYADLLEGKRVMVHPRAAVVGAWHKEREAKELTRISSTCKGTGAAQADKIMRLENGVFAAVAEKVGDELKDLVVSQEVYTKTLLDAQTLQIESAQGFELGINSGMCYPYCTSRDITPYQVLSDCGVPTMRSFPQVYVSCRVHPIRVGNAFDANGQQVGWSGPCYPDQVETDWESLGVPAERTTVTQKIRRVFSWSWVGFDRMYKALDPDAMFLNFVNYLESHPQFGHGATGSMVNDIEARVRKLNAELGMTNGLPFINWLGTGPFFEDVIERPSKPMDFFD